MEINQTEVDLLLQLIEAIVQRIKGNSTTDQAAQAAIIAGQAFLAKKS